MIFFKSIYSFYYILFKMTTVKKCTHYNNNLLVFANCCNKYFECHLCHNANNDHDLVRRHIKKVKCINCSTENNLGNECSNCKIKFGNMHCSICNIWCNNVKESYHCNGCGFCIIGKKEDYIHCNKCGICILKKNSLDHKCEDINKEEKCFICLNKLFSGLDSTYRLKCKHLIHKKCLDKLVEKTDNKKIPCCSLCKKSIVDSKKYEKKFDDKIIDEPMPQYYSNWKSNIYCNDCSIKSICKYHKNYNKCLNCKSYNTSILCIEKI